MGPSGSSVDNGHTSSAALPGVKTHGFVESVGESRWVNGEVIALPQPRHIQAVVTGSRYGGKIGVAKG